MIAPLLYQSPTLTTAIAASMVCGWLLWHEGVDAVVAPLLVILAGVVGWLSILLGQQYAASLSTYLLLERLAYACQFLLLVAWIALSMAFAGHRISPRGVALAAVEPLAVFGLALTNGAHGLVYTVTDVQSTATGLDVTLAYGPAVTLQVTYAMVVIPLGLGMVVDLALRSRERYRRQGQMALAGASLPLFAVLAISLPAPFPDDLSLVPLSCIGTVAIALLAIRWYDLGSIEPIAHERVVESFADAVVVVDAHDRVVGINRQALDLLGVDRPALGRSYADVAENTPLAGDPFASTRRCREEVTIRTDDDSRTYAVRVSPLGADDRATGRTITLTDVEAQKRRQRALEQTSCRLRQKNDQLEQFAEIVTHDLRNPLAVASGHLDLVAQGMDDGRLHDHVETIDRAHERMERLIDDVLALARDGDVVDRTTAVHLDDLAREAWSMIDAPDADLVVDDRIVVQADPARLRQALENLFRNAVEHGGPDITVSLGAIGEGDSPIGFYVEDDGSGIDEAHRERIFQSGVSGDDGTGLGLAIVEQIIEAHGWSIHVTAATDGGARFGVTGVDAESSPLARNQDD